MSSKPEVSQETESPSDLPERYSLPSLATHLLKVGDLLLRLDRQPRESDGSNRVLYLFNFGDNDHPDTSQAKPTTIESSVLVTVQRGEDGSVVINREARRIGLGYKVPVVPRRDIAQRVQAAIDYQQNLSPEEARTERVRQVFEQTLLEGDLTRYVFREELSQQGVVPVTRIDLLSGETEETVLEKNSVSNEGLKRLVFELFFNCTTQLMSQIQQLSDDHPLKAEGKRLIKPYLPSGSKL
ncbi:MAG: hypothetical protein A2785_02030 [Candidatus Chisholmbacteria bacterium RIFCSPHIGHO2_01_FULL_49_18]|uniref:Uncharacterized protein n=2 Tax=Candidatus Chisholmiibacteriota TaxID=1817900 RepID=A0A1G1VM39_9BACT|nr:MAG: hypothetical protein A2785_02030 [Candidatus Chisholmbacteria bacterium RIFCSPHIGHO2_01_FULL_49_18]OGY22600.1 MAG: hypothetical protein A3A65_05845 [Candidatus Chisholmbacteria bacterium RIFCSPLOWO2_01_FULL_49_14]